VTKGTCTTCRKTTAKAAMTRHLTSCGGVEGGSERSEAVLMTVCARVAPSDYWLHLEVPTSATLRMLDGWLRDLWLECCGHLSMFEIGGRTFSVHAEAPGAAPGPFGEREDESMDVAVGAVLRPGDQARHLYDMGSTTELEVRCLERRAGPGLAGIRLLARNEPPAIDCSTCDAPATTICPECSWEAAGTLCDGCAAEHACDDELYLPVVNSPRSGVCGYAGGW
jgi:hypothetical protein